MPKISVVIPVYNGENYLSDCLESLRKQTFSPEEIVVVDNASTDKTKEILEDFKRKEKKLKVIFNKKNLGYAQASNQGIKEVLKTNPDFIFVLNQDTLCEEKTLENLAKAAWENNSSVFAWQPLILLWPSKEIVQTMGDRIHFLGFGYSGGYKKLREEVKNEPQEIPYASGAAMLINVNLLKKVGFFDEIYFLYHEDLDLSLRASLLGLKIFLAPQAIVYHRYQEKISRSRWYWSERGRIIFLLKFYKWPTLLLIFPFWLLMEIGVWGYSLTNGWFFLKIKSFLSALKNLPQILRSRKILQKNRKITDRELFKFLETKFDFAGFTHPLLKYLVNPIFGFFGTFVRNFIFW